MEKKAKRIKLDISKGYRARVCSLISSKKLLIIFVFNFSMLISYDKKALIYLFHMFSFLETEEMGRTTYFDLAGSFEKSESARCQ